MDAQKFVQNVKKYCKMKGVKPTPACRESGAGPNLINDVEKGKKPSVEKVQLLATYLGVTVSDLLGEEKPAGNEASGQSEEAIELINLFDQGSPEYRSELLGYARGLAAGHKSQGTQKGGK